MSQIVWKGCVNKDPRSQDEGTGNYSKPLLSVRRINWPGYVIPRPGRVLSKTFTLFRLNSLARAL